MDHRVCVRGSGRTLRPSFLFLSPIPTTRIQQGIPHPTFLIPDLPPLWPEAVTPHLGYAGASDLLTLLPSYKPCHSHENVAFWVRAPWLPILKYPTCTQIHTFQNPLPFFLLIPLITVTLYTLLFYPVYHLSLRLPLQWKVHRDQGLLSNSCIAVAPGP